MLPDFDEQGYLPAGRHACGWSEFTERFGFSEQRQRLLSGLLRALTDLHRAGCSRVYIGGSFVTSKLEPNDYDCCWDPTGFAASNLNPVFRDIEDVRYGARRQKQLYFGEFVEANEVLLTFFSTDRRERRYGIIELDLTELPR